MKVLILLAPMVVMQLQAGRAHVHHEAQLSFSTDKNMADIQIEAPAQVIYGKSGLDEKTRKKMLTAFEKNLATGFRWPAKCELAKAISSSDTVHQRRKMKKKKKHHHDHDHKKDKHHDEKSEHHHKAKKKSHGHEPDHEKKHNHARGEHRDIVVKASFKCDLDISTKKLSIDLHKLLPGLKKLRVINLNKRGFPAVTFTSMGTIDI